MIKERPIVYCDTDGCFETFSAGPFSPHTTKAATVGLAVDHAGWSARRNKPDEPTRHYCPTCSMFGSFVTVEGITPP